MMDAKGIHKFAIPLSYEINDLILSKLGAENFSGRDTGKFVDAQNIAGAALINCLTTYLAQTILVLTEKSNQKPEDVMAKVVEEFQKTIKASLDHEIPRKVRSVLDSEKKVTFN